MINDLDYFTLIEKIKKKSKEFIVIFYSPLSAPCQKLLQTLEERSIPLPPVPIYWLDVNKARKEDNLILIQIPCIPAIMFKSHDNTRMTVGALSIEQLSQLIKEEMNIK